MNFKYIFSIVYFDDKGSINFSNVNAISDFPVISQSMIDQAAAGIKEQIGVENFAILNIIKIEC